MTWADVVPNLLIGLREGFEAGLIVSILLAACRAGRERADLSRDSRRLSTAPVWLGVLAAVLLSGAFAAVVALSAGALPTQAKQVAEGLLSVLAVSLVTAMIFWMWRSAASLSEQVRGEVTRLAGFGAGALTIATFLAVSREGIETTLFVWTAARASGHMAGPLAGAAAGLAGAVLLCWLLYRRAIRLNVAAFFNWTAAALIVIAAGVISYGLGELQNAGILAGQRWIAFDLTAHAHPASWLVSLVSGVTDLAPKMTVLQVAAWIAYLALVIPAYVKAGRTAATADGGHGRREVPAPAAGRRERLAGRWPFAVAGGLIVLPLLAAGAIVAALPAAGSASTLAVTVTRTTCARDWTSATAGTHTFTVDNRSGLPGEINLDDASGDIVAEIETLGPGTSAQLTATLVSGTYVFKCFMGSEPTETSAPVQVTGGGNSVAASQSGGHPSAAASPLAAVKPVTVAELTGPNMKYEAYAARQLRALAHEVARIEADLRGGDLAAAKQDWLTAQTDWERVGASYDSFGPLSLAVDGLPNGLAKGVSDMHFTGLHRLEYGLWHGQSATTLLAVATTLAAKVAAVQHNLKSAGLAGDPANLSLRAHEILEDALRDHLSGLDDQGGGAAFAETYADIQVTRVVLGYLTPLLATRQPALAGIAGEQLDILKSALLATRVNGRWESLTTVSLTARERVDAAIGSVLETLAAVPDLLEVPPVH